MRRPLRPLLLALAVLLALAATPLPAGASGTVKSFYSAKKKQTTPAAYRRAREHVRSVVVGMSELEFLEAMRMEVLAHRGQPQDARMDGYLAEASRRRNARAPEGHRLLVFGFVEAGHEVEGFVVDLVDRRVFAVIEAPALAANLVPADAGAGTGPATR